jgi:hypothetical protein
MTIDEFNETSKTSLLTHLNHDGLYTKQKWLSYFLTSETENNIEMFIRPLTCRDSVLNELLY